MRIIKIDENNYNYLEVFSKNETELKHINEPETGLFIAESPNVIIRAINDGYEPVEAVIENNIAEDNEELMANLEKWDTPTYIASSKYLECIKGFQMTRGALCVLKRRLYKSYTEICANVKNIAILEDVMNPTNLGAIFRSAAALNIDAVLLTKGCSDPLYRRAARVSVGNVFQVPWTYIDDIQETLSDLKNNGYTTMAMALDENALSISDSKLKNADKTVIVLGTEGYGLHNATIKACDYTVMIPMSNSVDSLNVAAASAVAFWELCAK